MKVTRYRIKARDPHGYYGSQSLYLWPGDFDPDSMLYFGPVEAEDASAFSSRYEAMLEIEKLRKELFYFKEYGFSIEAFEDEVPDWNFGGFVFPDGTFAYVPHYQHADWVWKVYKKDKDDFMCENRCCEITNSSKGPMKEILLPYCWRTDATIPLTEEQAKAILDMELPLTPIGKSIMEDSLR